MSTPSDDHEPGTPIDRSRGSWRLVTLAWSVWLLAAWGLTLATASVVPATRWMTYSAMVGMMAVWPAFRLSQGPRAAGGLGPKRGLAPVGLVLVDWVSMAFLLQIVIWPLWLSTGKIAWIDGALQVLETRWTLVQTGAIGGTLLVWSALTAAIVAWGRARGTRPAATLAMAGCVLVILGGPLLQAASAAIGLGGGGWHRVGPIADLWALTEAKADVRPTSRLPQIVAIGVAAAVAWVGVAALARSVPNAATPAETPSDASRQPRDEA